MLKWENAILHKSMSQYVYVDCMHYACVLYKTSRDYIGHSHSFVVYYLLQKHIISLLYVLDISSDVGIKYERSSDAKTIDQRQQNGTSHHSYF